MNEIKRFDIYASLSCTAMTKAEAVLNIKPDNEDGLYCLYSDVEKLNQWQPIETAPKDGTSIVGWNEEFGFKICNYLGHENYEGEFEYGWIVFSDGDTYEFLPTHWIPLPQLPPQK